jgi:uncharacterized protein (DUF952 family)
MARHPVAGVRAGDRVAVVIYKICTASEWAGAVAAREYRGSEHDRRDGFIHFSTAAQMRETAAKHFAGQADLLLVAVDAAALGSKLAWEPSRDGDLFPHLYDVLPVSAATSVTPLPLGPDGLHHFPETG